MHDSAYAIGSRFLATYAGKRGAVILEIGALDVNGSLRDASPPNATYLGLDYQAGAGVDMVVEPGQSLPLESEFADVIISSSQMEHDVEFWVNLNEMYRVLKTGGVIYINTPSNGNYHAYPSDAWRFYPDAGKAFVKLGRKNNYPITLLESFIAKRIADQWNDFVCVLFKGEWPETQPVNYLSDAFESYNVWRLGAKELSRRRVITEDQSIVDNLRKEVLEKQQVIEKLQNEVVKKLQNEVVKLQTKLTRHSDRRLKKRISRVLLQSKLASQRWSNVAMDSFHFWTKASGQSGVFGPGGIEKKAP